MIAPVIAGVLALSATGAQARDSPDVLPPAQAFQQCGGKGWKGATTCVQGFMCSNILNGEPEPNLYYSQCVPDPDQEGPIEEEKPVALFGQCGGQGYTGSTVCDFGLKCAVRSEFFSICVEDETKAGLEEPIAGLYEQCGGLGWTGAKKCTFGSVCVFKDRYHSLCEPEKEKLEEFKPVGEFKQCGGEGYTGPKTCAFGLVCVRQTIHYSQCEKDTTVEALPLLGIYEKCGGVGHTGQTQCERGLICSGGAYHKQCINDPALEEKEELPPAKLYSQCGGKAHPGPFACEYPLKCDVVNEFYSQCNVDPTFLLQTPVESHGQCGGKDYTGSTRCPDGQTCKKTNVYYSGCEPKAPKEL